jgi:F-type H+-transporting ATPase subunit b
MAPDRALESNVIAASTILALAEGEGGILSPDGSLLVIFILFIALVFALNRILFKPIGHVLAERERLTEGSDVEVRAMLGDIDTRLAQYEENIRDARSEGYRVLEAKRAELVALRQSAIEAARTDADSRIASARDQILKDAEAAKATLACARSHLRLPPRSLAGLEVRDDRAHVLRNARR